MVGGARQRLLDAADACAANLRSRNLRRAQAAFGMMWAGEWAATVAVGVIAFHHGGAGAVGAVAAVRMAPAALFAPLAATVADQRRREWVLAAVGVVRAATLAAAAIVIATGGAVLWAYAAIVVATIAQTLFRPAHSALLPSLCSTPAELTAANVVRGLLDSLATLLGPLAAAVLLKLSGPAAVLLAASVASGVAGVLARGLSYEAAPRLPRHRAAPVARVSEGIRLIASDGALALLTALTALQTFTRGALAVFSVVVAIKLLAIGSAGVGVLGAAVGAGAVVGSLAAAITVRGGGLARWFGAGVALWGAPLVGVAVFLHLWWTLPMLALIGIGNAFVDVGVFTLIARLADDAVLARVFAAFEAIITLGVAAGAALAPVLIAGFGARTALIAVGLLTPVAVIAAWRQLRRVDRRMRVRDADIALLRGVPMLRRLPEATIEQLAASLATLQLPSGELVFEQGDAGDGFYVIERGRAEVFIDGSPVRTMSVGEGFGEIALIRAARRTASVRATEPTTLRLLSRGAFVAAVTGYSSSAGAADDAIDAHLDRFAPALR